jgi:hypothetical protein
MDNVKKKISDRETNSGSREDFKNMFPSFLSTCKNSFPLL